MVTNQVRRGHGDQRQSGSRGHGSYRLVGIAMLVGVVALFGGAGLLSQRLRPPTGLQALSVVTAQAAPSFGFILSLPPGSTSIHDSMPLVVPSPEPTSDDGVNMSLLEEVEAAYSKFWDVRAEAALNVDPSGLPEVAAGPALEREQAEIGDLAARGVVAVIDVDHEVGLVSLSENEAELYDEYVNRSYVADPASKEPIGAPEPDQLVKVSYRMQKIDGVWKVVDSERHD